MEGITPGTVALAAAALIALGLVWPRRTKGPVSERAEWAAEHGWRFVARDESLARRFVGYPFAENGAGTATGVLFGRYRDHLVLNYRYRPAADTGAEARREHGSALRITGVVIPRDDRTLQVTGRRVRRRTPGLSAVGDDPAADTRFAAMYDVSGDPGLAREVLTPAVVRHLMSAVPRTSFRLAEGYALTWSRGDPDIDASLADADTLIALLDAASGPHLAAADGRPSPLPDLPAPGTTAA